MKRKSVKKVISVFVGILLVLGITVFFLEYGSDYKVTETIHLDAPVITRKSIVIDAPIEEVWAVFADVDNWDTWQKEIVSPKINGAFEPGKSFDWKSNGLTITSTLLTVKTNEKVVWSGPAFGAFAIHTWHFSEQDGKTTVRVEESMEGWLVSLLKSKFQSSLDVAIENWLQYLKTRSESR